MRQSGVLNETVTIFNRATFEPLSKRQELKNLLRRGGAESGFKTPIFPHF
jgi:hypothetical protein